MCHVTNIIFQYSHCTVNSWLSSMFGGYPSCLGTVYWFRDCQLQERYLQKRNTLHSSGQACRVLGMHCRIDKFLGIL
jgi:hypothetical protein